MLKKTKKSKKAPSRKPRQNKRIKPVSKKLPDKKPTKPKRDKKGRLLPGNTANPAGRPKSNYKYGEYYQELLESKDVTMSISSNVAGKEKKLNFKFSTDKNFRLVLFARLLNEGLNGNITAIRELLDRSEGRPTQPLAGALGLETGRSYEELLKDVKDRDEKLLPFRTGTDRT